MASRYYLHRISHEGNVSYGLLEKGFLTLGWSKFSDTDILDAAREPEYKRFNPISESLGEGKNRSRWCMWYFARMEKGDKVVVPLYGGLFSVYEVDEIAKSISDLEQENPEVYGAWDSRKIVWKDHRLYDEVGERQIDLGFFIKVKPIVQNVPRNYVTGELISRMKIRQTSADITDIADVVDSGIEAGLKNKPITLYEDVIDILTEKMQASIISTLDSDKFEQLIKWYLERCGARSAWIPAKNESGKRDGADADIIAEFDNLKYIVYVQAKWHKGETADWAVHQIDSYKNQKSEGDPAYTYAAWAITSADRFTEKAQSEADKKNVRLIAGKEFARMLINMGLLDVNDAFK